MKFKWQFWTGWTFAAVVLAYCVLAYIFMWPPIVTYQSDHLPAHACINNLRMLDAAINQFGVEHKKHAGDAVTFEDITPYLRLTADGKIQPCPDGGKYSVTVFGNLPTCSFGTNSSAPVRIGWFNWGYPNDAGIYHTLP
jgi:hypothetical protein